MNKLSTAKLYTEVQRKSRWICTSKYNKLKSNCLSIEECQVHTIAIALLKVQRNLIQTATATHHSNVLHHSVQTVDEKASKLAFVTRVAVTATKASLNVGRSPNQELTID